LSRVASTAITCVQNRAANCNSKRQGQ
jgi:hypothetical protein